MKKYYLDIRGNCMAVRLIGTDSAQLQENSEGVIAFWSGYIREDGCWVIQQFKHEQARALVKLLNT
tara:strand:+ start:48636 stop:48833 length:198 start_codon:yes stop_codon:yes gene_type:complete